MLTFFAFVNFIGSWWSHQTSSWQAQIFPPKQTAGVWACSRCLKEGQERMQQVTHVAGASVTLWVMDIMFFLRFAEPWARNTAAGQRPSTTWQIWTSSLVARKPGKRKLPWGKQVETHCWEVDAYSQCESNQRKVSNHIEDSLSRNWTWLPTAFSTSLWHPRHPRHPIPPSDLAKPCCHATVYWLGASGAVASAYPSAVPPPAAPCMACLVRQPPTLQLARVGTGFWSSKLHPKIAADVSWMHWNTAIPHDPPKSCSFTRRFLGINYSKDI